MSLRFSEGLLTGLRDFGKGDMPKDPNDRNFLHDAGVTNPLLQQAAGAAGGMLGVDMRSQNERTKDTFKEGAMDTWQNKMKLGNSLIKAGDVERGSALIKMAEAQKASEEESAEGKRRWEAEYGIQVAELMQKGNKDGTKWTRGKTFTAKDSKGNDFIATSLTTDDGQSKVVYEPLGEGPEKPVGKTIFTGEYGLGAAGAAAQKGDEAASADFGKQRGEALRLYREADASLQPIRRAMELTNQVITGGLDERARRFFEQQTGKMPADKAELIYLLNTNVLEQLKPTFGAQFTANEGEWLQRVMPNENDSPEVIQRKLQRIEEFILFKQKQQRSIIEATNYDEYANSLLNNGIQFNFEEAEAKQDDTKPALSSKAMKYLN